RRSRHYARGGDRGTAGDHRAQTTRRTKGRDPIMPTKSKAKGGLSKKQLQHLEKRLLEERARVMKELGHYGEAFNSSLQASDGDLSTRIVAVATLARRTLELVSDYVVLRLVYNRGAAFGLDLGDASRWIFLGLAIVALVVLGLMVRATRAGDKIRLLALALVCGGAFGNVIDRLRSAQGVVDFIEVG